MVLQLRAENRPATDAERQVLQQWTGWGATPYLFDERKRFAATFAAERAHLRDILSDDEYAKARTSTLNAHYTDPAYARVVWHALQRFGVPAGAQLRVLEPGVGAGRFLADAPADAEIVGIEVDPITAAIARALYPDAQIHTESFADTRPPEEDFDVVVGNVPFGKYKVTDRRYNPGRRHAIHNHFILKSLEFTRPGGIVILITSRYTLDGTDQTHKEARERMAALGDLLGAVRLPSGAHQEAAGTPVVTDMLIFRRRAESEPAADADWLDIEATILPGSRPGVTPQPIEINRYFLQHPEMVLGALRADIVRHGSDLVVQPDPPVGTALAAALDQVAQRAQETGRTYTERMVFHGTLEKYDGLLEIGPENTFTEIRNGRPVPHVPAKTQVRELRELIGLRDIAVALLDEESEHHLVTPRMTQLRAELNRRYDAYVARFGSINRFKVPPSGEAALDDNAAERRTYPRMGGFRNDPFAPYVFALEKFDEDHQSAAKADVFAKRVVAPPEPLTRADSPEDAALICWDQHNEIRLDVVADLLGLDNEGAAREALGTLVYDDPAGGLVRRMEYLSGNVRRKLAAAEKAASKDPAFAVNVEALREVIPRDLQPAEIQSRLGAAWVSAKYVQQFLREILEDDDIKVSNLGARWSVKGGDTGSLLARTVWGTQARSTQALASNLLNNQEILVTRKVPPDGKAVTDRQATAFALAKSRQLDDRFRMWLWEDPERAETLLRYYNDRYNAIVPPTYNGVQITAPGLSRAYTLHPHQKAAVARIRSSKHGVGLYHGTGAGKTLEMVVGGMELTRLGLAKKPVYAVPKGVLGQFQREFLQAYPRARILVADSSDLTGERRHKYVARWSTGNWDAVIISHTAFKKIPMSKPARLDYIRREVKRLEAHLGNADDGDRYTVKDIENQIATLKGRIEEELKTPGDSGVEFERTGSTYIFYDEAHTLKNLRVISSIGDLALDGNQITADMDLKLSYLRKNYGGRVTTQATATPVDNSPMEILTAIKYLGPDLLRDEWGIEEDDQFVSTYIQPVNRVEMSPDGNSFSTRARYARYVNQTELKRVLFTLADVKLKRDLQLGEPAIIGGEMRILEAEASAELREHMQSLGKRMMAIRLGSPALKYNRKGKLVEDNTLWISTDGRLASLDVRLVNKSTDEAQKVDVAADELFRLWQLHKDDVYYDDDGNEEPNRGSLQLAFCDLGVPGPDKEFVFYEALREALTARGMPGSLIRFDQEAKNPQQKARLDKDAREGRVAVLVGSRSGLGTGRNLQNRVIHVMQVDPTWKATPIIQSLGRGKRQGNQNKEIHHTAIITKKSYDPFLWQKVATKQAFAEAILDINDTSRILEAAEDGDDGRIPAGVMFAVAADRPELEQLERVEGMLAKLRLDQQMWHDEQFAYEVTGEQGQRRIRDLKARMQEAQAAMERHTATRGDAFTMTVVGRVYDERREAGEALAQRLERLVRSSVNAGGRPQDAHVGELGSIPVHALVERSIDGLIAGVYFQDVPVDTIWLSANGLAEQDRVGLVRKLENALDGLETVHAKAQEHVARIEANIARAKELVGKPFPQQAELDKIEAQHHKLTKALGVQGATEATEPEVHDAGVIEPGADLVDAAVHDAMVMTGGSADGWVEVDPTSLTPDDLSDTTRGLLDAPADGSRDRTGPYANPVGSDAGTTERPAAEADGETGDAEPTPPPYPDQAAAAAGEAAVLADFAAWRNLDVVKGMMSGRGQELAEQMEQAGIELTEALRHARESTDGAPASSGDPWVLELFHDLAGAGEEFLSDLDSPHFKPNGAGRAMRDLTEQVAHSARDHAASIAPMEGRRRPPEPDTTPANPSPTRPPAHGATSRGPDRPFDPDRWYQHTMLGGTLSDSRGAFLNDVVEQLRRDGSDVAIEADAPGAVMITGPNGSVNVTPLTEDFPASVAQGYEAAIDRLLHDAQRALHASGPLAGDLFDSWLSEQLIRREGRLKSALTGDDDEAAFRQAMRVHFYEVTPWAHPDTADRPQPAPQTQQETAADAELADASTPSRAIAPEATSGDEASMFPAESAENLPAAGEDHQNSAPPADTRRTAQEPSESADDAETVPATSRATVQQPGHVPNTAYQDRSESWAAEQAALTAYRRWASDHATRLATGQLADGLMTAAETAMASSQMGRTGRLLGVELPTDWAHLLRLADQCRAVVEQWEREDGRSTEGNWEIYTTLRDHASRYRSTVEDRSSDTYQRWARSPEPLTLDEDATEFIPGILPWDQYTVTGPRGIHIGPVSGRDLAAGLTQLVADGIDLETSEGGLVVAGPGGVQFSVQLTAVQPAAAAPSATTPTPAPQPASSNVRSPEPDVTSDPKAEIPPVTASAASANAVGTRGEAFGSALPQVANLAIVLEGYASPTELAGGRRYVTMAAERLRRVLTRQESGPLSPAHQDADAVAAAVIESAPRTPADTFSIYDRLAETAVQLTDGPRPDVCKAAQEVVRYTERHLARMQARRSDLAELLLDAADIGEEHTSVLEQDDPLRLTALWYQDSAEIGRALSDIFDTFPKWPHAYDDQGGPYSDRLRGAMLMLRRPHDTVATALTDWTDVTSYALGAAQEAEAAGDGVSRYTLRDLARKAFQHHQRLAAHELGMEEIPYEAADDFVGGANKAESAWNWWMASDTGKALLDSTPGESTAREALAAARDTRYAADFVTLAAENLDEVNRRVTAMAHAAYDLVLSLHASDFLHPDDDKRLDDLVRYSYEHAVACRASTALPETVAAVQEGVAQRRQRLDAENSPAPEPRRVPASTGVVLEIEHHYRGTVVRGTTDENADAPVRAALDHHNFRWSRNQGFWYLKRNMSRPKRNLHVRNLTNELTRMGRRFDMVEEPEQDSASEIVIPVGEPYTSKDDAKHDFWEIHGALWGLKDTPAGRRLIGRGLTDQGVQTRPDGEAVWLAMEELCDGPVGRVSDPFTHPAGIVVERCTKLARTVLVLAQNLEEERYRAPVVMGHFRTMKQYTVQLASRITATAQQGDDWQQIFGTPALPASQTEGEHTEPVGQEPAPGADSPRHSDVSEDEPTSAPSSQTAGHESVKVQQRRIEITVAARSAAGHLLVNVAIPAERTGAAQEVPDLRGADVQGLTLPAHAALPLLARPERLSESLVSDEEVDAWLSEHLPDSPVAPAWNAPAVHAVIQRTVRDLLRDTMSPEPEDVAEWLVDAAREIPALIRAAHANKQADFRADFATAADELIADASSERLLWTYLKEDGRQQILDLAGPRAHRELRTQTVAPQPQEPGRLDPDEQPTASSTADENDRARKRAEFQAEAEGWSAEMHDDAKKRAVRVALADPDLRSLLGDGRSPQEALRVFTDWLAHADLSATGTGGDHFRDWFVDYQQGVEQRYAEDAFEEVYEAVSAAATDLPAGEAAVRPADAVTARRGETDLSLTQQHLEGLPHYDRRNHHADAHLAVLTTIRVSDGHVDALLLLQSIEPEEDPWDDPLIRGAQILATNGVLSPSLNGQYRLADLLGMANSQVLPLASPVPWTEVETLAALPHEQALQRLPLITGDKTASPNLPEALAPTESRAAAKGPLLREPQQQAHQPGQGAAPLQELIGAFGDHVVIGHLGPSSPADAGKSAPDTAPEPASPSPAGERQEESVTTTEPETAAEGPWTSRIKIVSDRTGTYVTGTTGAPAEDGLRELLKRDRNFKYEKGRWRYNGMRGHKEQVLGEVRAFLAARDAQETAVAAVASGKYPPTPQQQATIDAAVEGKNVAVQALAGTGKTATLVMIAARMLERRIGYIAFNRSIADEAAQRFGRNVTARTSHSFALQDLRNTPYRHKVSIAGSRNSGARRPRDVAAALGITAEIRLGDRDGKLQYVGPEDIAKIVMGALRRYRQSADTELGRQHLGEKWAHVPAARTLLEYARRAWADIADPNSNKIFFDHDDYLKIWALSDPRLNFDTIFFDEAQDINPVLKKVIQDQDAQIIVVGDSNQAIYEFRGAVDALRDWPADVVLPLTQSWRFGPAVAEVGNAYLTLLESDLRLEGAPTLDTVLGTVEEPDAILTFSNVGAISAVFAGFETGRRVALVGGGRDIEDIARAARDLQQGRRTKHPELSAFENWNEVKEYAESDEDATALQTFVRLVDRYTPQGLINMIRDLVPEEARDEETRPELVVSTAHKSKGREWDQVQVWSDFPQPKEDTKTGELILPAQDKLRLAYVTVTRARKRLDIGSLGWIHTVGTLADTLPAKITPNQAPEQASSATVADETAAPEVLLSPPSPETAESTRPDAVSEEQPEPAITEPANDEPAISVHQAGAASGPAGLEATDDNEATAWATPWPAQTEPGPERQPEPAAPTLRDPGEPLNGADQPSLFTGRADNPPADEQTMAPAAQDAETGIAPLPWDDQKIKKRGTAGLSRGQKSEIPNLAREMREALGDNQVRDVWEQDNPWAQFEENLRHTQNGIAEPDSALNTLVAQAAEQLRAQIDQLAAEAFSTFENRIQDRADDPDQLAELDAELADAHRLPELTDPLVRRALSLCLEAVDDVERTARSRKVRVAAARDALQQVIGLAGTSYSPDGQQVWPNVDAALAPVKVQVDRARERIAELSNSTVTEQYARLRALIAIHETQPTAGPQTEDTPAPVPGAAENVGVPPAPAAQEKRTPEPLTDRDIAEVLGKIDPSDFGQLIFQMGQKRRGTPQLYEGWIRLPSEPGYNEAGNEVASAYSRSGSIEIEVKVSDDVVTTVRAGHLTLAKVVAWLRPALPPERRQLVADAWRTGNAMARSELGFEVIGETGRWKAADKEVWRILVDTKATVIKEALEAHLTGTAAAQVARIRSVENQEQGQMLPIDFGSMENSYADIATLERVTALRAVLPAQFKGACRLSELTPGDCITGVSEERLPFIVRERPDVSADTEVFVVGDLVVGPGDLRSYTWESGRYPEDHVEPLLLPQSLDELVDLPADAPHPLAPVLAASTTARAALTAAEPAREVAPPVAGSPTAEPGFPAPEEAPGADAQQPPGPVVTGTGASIPPRHLPYESQSDFLDDLCATEDRYTAWANSATGRLLLSEARELQEETGVMDANEAARVQTAFRGAILAADTTHSSAEDLLSACRGLYATVAEAGRSMATRRAFASDADRHLLLAVYAQSQEQLARLDATTDVQALLDSEHDGARLLSRFKETSVAERPDAPTGSEATPAQAQDSGQEPPSVQSAPLRGSDTGTGPERALADPAEPKSTPAVAELPTPQEESIPESGTTPEGQTSSPAETDTDDFDSLRDVVGDEPLVDGVVYSEAEWVPAPEEGVRRRTDEQDEPVSAEELAEMEVDLEYEALIEQERIAVAESVTGEPDVPGRDDFDKHFEDIVALLRSAEPPAETQTPAPRRRFSTEDEQRLRDQYAATRQALSGILTSIDADPILPAPENLGVEAGDARALETAMGSAEAEAGYYWGTPEWTMIRSIGHARKELRGAIREALLTYAETTLRDIRAHGINRTIEARTARAISHGAMHLARRLERSGLRDSRSWRAVWGLHRAAATRADRLTGLLPASQRIDLADRLLRAWRWLTERLAAHRQNTGNGRGDDGQGRMRTTLSNSVDSIRGIYGAVSERLGALTQHPVWLRIASVWSAVREAVNNGWLGVGRFMADRQTLGTGKTLWVRSLEIISSGAQTLINRLARGGGRKGLRWNLLRVLRHAAEDHIAHLHGHLPGDVSTPLGTYESVVSETAEQTPAANDETTPLANAPEGDPGAESEPAPVAESLAGDPDRFREVVLQAAAKEYTLALDLSYDLGIPVAEADSLLTRMEELGIVGPQKEGGVREVLVTRGDAENLMDASPAPGTPAPRWQPTNEPLTLSWFDEVRTAVRRDVQPYRGLSRRDLMSLLNHANARPGDRAEAGRRANECIDLFLQGRGDEVPRHLAGEGFVYVRGEADRGWALRETAPAPAPPTPAGMQTQAAGEQKIAAGAHLPRRRRPTPTEGLSKIEQAAAGRLRQPSPEEDNKPTVNANTFAVQAQRIQDRADFAQAAANSPAEERAAGVLQTIAANSRATADKIAGTAHDGASPASPHSALTAEAFLAALRTTAQARGAQIPDDLLATAMEAAQEAAAAVPQRSAGFAAAPPRPSRRGQAEREQAEHRLHGQRNNPSGVGRR
ncbi:UvrD-helicase domain-containing protein [Streptomyces sp. 8L]|uniref:UvrD-helicase domain-containing protein n=1 Tax=Streptomyces sp. 8L TaxID=2877242 RepID=UPI001CD3B507|nr:UvrD-helicase domain-containing protein [Streptomyces sp. 8L]MCA1217376.1 AAA family ATPase [Streptomyces sp. 8L]